MALLTPAACAFLTIPSSFASPTSASASTSAFSTSMTSTTCGGTKSGLSRLYPSTRRSTIRTVREDGELHRLRVVVVRRPSSPCASASIFHITERLLTLVEQPEDIYD